MEALLTKNLDSEDDSQSENETKDANYTVDTSIADNDTVTTTLSPEQQQYLLALTESMSREQALWTSGYLAGLAESRILPETAATPAVPSVVDTATVTVLYGTETGNAREVAERAGQVLRQKSLVCQVADMESFKSNRLRQEQYLIIVTATHGEGDPPEPARSFYEFLMSRKAPKLTGARFAVLGLGDSSYEHFCQTAKDFDARLEELGAERIQELMECDVDYEVPAAAWIEDTATSLKELIGRNSAGQTPLLSGANLAKESASTSEFHPGNPFLATVLDRIMLNGRGSDKTTYHLEFSLSDSGLEYTAGDALGVTSQNDPALVEEIVTALGLESDPELAEELQYGFELTVLTQRFISSYGQAVNSKALIDLATDKKALRHYLNGRQIVDVVREYPPANGFSAVDFQSLLRKLEPRLYSLASSPIAFPEEAHITVAEVGFRSPYSTRHGVASGHLGMRLDLDDSIPVHIERNDRFRLPKDPLTPIIMIGAGTGVAPYRAFLQERAELGASGRSWLFFGERRFRTDFLYQAEWQHYLKEGVLTRMDVAFSRDQSEKIYVQDRIRQQGRDLFAWIEDGAHLYVCGDAKHMAPDVHAALIDVVAQHGARDRDTAQEYINKLTADRRYKRDVY